MKSRVAAFTLVELLGVIAILAVLMGVLVPVLGKARTAANSALCQSNLRQLQQAALEYSVDNRGYLPPAHFDFITKDLHRWHGTRPTMNDPFDFTFSPLRPYLQKAEIKKCPSFEPAVSGGFEQSAGGYGYNDQYLGSSLGIASGSMNNAEKEARYDNVPAKVAMIHRPAETIMFADAAMAWPNLIEYSFLEPPLNGTPSPPSPSIHFRHNGTANIAWVDGHITSEHLEWTYDTNLKGVINAEAHLGYFGPRDNTLFDRD